MFGSFLESLTAHYLLVKPARIFDLVGLVLFSVNQFWPRCQNGSISDCLVFRTLDLSFSRPSPSLQRCLDPFLRTALQIIICNPALTLIFAIQLWSWFFESGFDNLSSAFLSLGPDWHLFWSYLPSSSLRSRFYTFSVFLDCSQYHSDSVSARVSSQIQYILYSLFAVPCARLQTVSSLLVSHDLGGGRGELAPLLPSQVG